MIQWKKGLLLLTMFLMVIATAILSIHAAEAATFSERARNLTEIEKIRVSTSGDKVRIVVDAANEVDYQTKTLKSPGRVIVDIKNAWVNTAKVSKSETLNSKFAKAVRISQFDPKTVRIVVDTEMASNPHNYDVFSLSGGSSGYRIVMDFGNLRSGSANNTTISTSKTGSKSRTPAIRKKTTETKQETTKRETVKKNEEKKDKKETKETKKSKTTINKNPGIAGKRIAVDAGHGGSDVGAIGPSGITEKTITLRIAKKLEELLKKEGATVYMTRRTDTEVAKDGADAADIDELQARVDVGNNNGTDIFLSIHMDSFTNAEVSGTTGYYYEQGSAESRELAEKVKDRLVQALHTTDRGTKGSNFYVCRKTDMPAALIEVAFISNPSEESLLNAEAGIEKAARAILSGLKDYFG